MTQAQYQWLQDNGYDPTVYDVDPRGRVIKSPVAPEPIQQKMSPLRAAGTSFLGNLLPSAAGLGGAKLGMMAGAPFGPVGVGIGAIGGGLGAGYLAGRGQEAVLEKVAPSAIEEMQRAETDQPVASYLGGFAPNALAFRPSVQGMKGLLRPTVRGTETLGEALAKPEFLAPAANIAANVAGSTAGQLVNVAQGGEFSAPRFAADVALGTLFNKPNALGRRIGFQDIPEPRREAPGDLAAAREKAAFMEYPPSEFVTPREERLDIGAEKIAPERFFTEEGKPMTEKAMAKDYTNWWKSETEPTTDLIKGAAEEIKMKVPKERLAELAQDPEVGAALRDPSRMPAFIAKQAEQSLEDVYQMMARREVEQRFASPEEAANQRALQELRAERGLPSETALSDVEAAYAASKKTATDAAREVYTRLQRPEGAGENKITQEDINLATEIANRRGLKIELDRAYAGDQQVRGLYMVDADGNRIIRVNPLMATADTAIHEIGHDIFKGVTNKGMRRSLMDTAMDSPAYKAELAARAEEVKQGKITQELANDIALEEGLIQAFGEQMPQVKRGELRAWYQAFKASMKQLVTGKMSPEDALAWMDYATTEAVPWKGVAVAKTSGAEERLQRAQQETPEFKNWFGESKVVDAEGKPLVMYHGTGYGDIAEFQGQRNVAGHFTLDPEFASDFALDPWAPDYSSDANWNPTTYPVYLKAEKIFDVRDPVARAEIKSLRGPVSETRGWDWTVLEKPEVIRELKAKGYDSYFDFEQGSNKSPSGIAIFESNQIKSATANRGTFSPESADIRYQRGPVGKAADAVKGRVDKTLGEIDQITRRGGIFETVGRAMTRAYNTTDAMLGKARSLGRAISAMNASDATKLTTHLYNEYRNRKLITPAPEIAEAYNQWRSQAKPFWVNETNKAGHQVRSSKGLRDRFTDEFWGPFHKTSEEARDILANKVGTPEYQKLKDDYLRDATDDYLSQGVEQTKAQERALADFEQERALVNRSFDPSAPATFAGARKPMGRPLPESWIEKDFRKLFESYNQRSAKDYAAQEHFEKSPEVMAALGSKTFFNDQPIPANVLQSTPVIAPDTSVQSVMREFSGQPLQVPGKAVRTFGSAASALALQTISRIGDIGGTVTKPLAYIGLGDYGAYMGGMAEKLSNWSKLQARSIESGLNNPNAHQNYRQVVGVTEDSAKYMQKVLDSLGYITGSSKLESVARTLAQAQGEMIVSINKRKASTGDKDAVRFLDTLNNDWRTQSDMALAAQFGQMMQGTYDMRQLPAWFLEGGAAPYLTWSKWSMGQMNNFRKFAVEPAMQGNLKPLIAQVLVGMAGGGAIEQIQEWLSGKESKAVKWSELQSWAEQNEGTIGTDGGELLLQKLMIMAQKTGTFGFAGDLAMMPINALVGDTQSSVGVFPAAELFADLTKNVAGALTAIDKGEDVGLVLQRFGKNVLVGKTQMARVASTWADEVFNEGTENLRSADRRKMRLFEELSGTGRSNGMFPVSYENLAEQKFERGSVTEKTGEEAFELVKTARESATSREDYASRIRKYKTSQNQIMPSLERQPMKAARYLSFVEGAEEGAGAETLKRYLTREQENKYRKSLIEGMSGLR
jgi:hypothetical protein